MRGGGKLLVVEVIVRPPNQPGGKVGDVFMLVRTGGRNRTEADTGCSSIAVAST